MNFLSYSSLLIDDQEFIQQWTLPRHCIRCGVKYTEKENIGQFLCSQHAYIFNPNDKYNKMLCCGKFFRGYKAGISAASWGCIKADHTQQHIPYNETHKIYVSKSMMSHMILPKIESADGVETINGENCAIVYRHDFREENRKVAERDLLTIEGYTSMSKPR